ncbi:hypothetical protein KY290_033203 [Solanum tuberosum]|uniref:Uncharacterized protein n=1 Tax=Solanum tuberosum TaxID=4113 RepID=A0ABQ7U074_SOLTU|nr:hypothetical protein KY289_032576 [Solanum tuberosum]KAH0647194.1 hypothetical protein KY285_032442 [Solanum tuberosum]KAH0740160.1 hypothetical protein KY290_033203 [Solanum tuberosum]
MESHEFMNNLKLDLSSGVGVRVGRGGEDVGWVEKEWRKHRGRGGWGGEDDLGGVWFFNV